MSTSKKCDRLLFILKYLFAKEVISLFNHSRVRRWIRLKSSENNRLRCHRQKLVLGPDRERNALISKPMATCSWLKSCFRGRRPPFDPLPPSSALLAAGDSASSASRWYSWAALLQSQAWKPDWQLCWQSNSTAVFFPKQSYWPAVCLIPSSS